MLPRLLGYVPPQLPGAAWIVPIVGTVVFAYGGWRSYKALCASCTTACPE